MKFLIVVHYFPPHIGGMEGVVSKQAKSLAQAGHRVTVLTCSHDASLPPEETSQEGYKIIRVKAINTVERRFGMAFPIPYPGAIFTIIRAVKQCDILHVHDVFYPLSHISGLASLFANKPTYLTQHVGVVDHPSTIVALVQKALFATAGSILFRRAKKIVVYNDNVRTFLLSRRVPDEKIILNNNGIDTDFFMPTTKKEKNALRVRYSVSENKKIILFVGRLIPEKGYATVAKLTSKVYHPLIVGGGVIPEEIKKNDATFFGPASQETLLDLYRLCDIFVFPATVEVFPLVMQEAMACGVPIVTTNNPHYDRYGLDKEKFMTTKPDEKSIRKVLDKIITNEAEMASAGKYSRQFAVRNFSWSHNYPKEYAIYEEVK